MATPRLIPMKKVDWIENMDPDDRPKIKNEEVYRLHETLDVIEHKNGRLAIVLHQEGEYVGDTILTHGAKIKLLHLIQKSLRKERR